MTKAALELEPWSGTTTATVPLKMFAVPTALQDQSLTVDAAAMLPTLLLQALGKSSFERDSRMPAQIDAKIVIIGSGPAGYTAAIYAARAMLEPVLIQGIQPGGQLTITTDVENYPGFADVIQGPWLMEQMEKQAAHVGTKIVTDLVIKLELAQRPFRLTCDSGDVYLAETVILATGAQARWLGMPSEEKFKGFGVSACATCDGFFYRGKEVMVVGGGNTAVEEALFLTNFASQVTIVHRRDHFRAERILQERLFKHPKIKVVWDSAIDEICGTENPGKVTHVRLKNVKSGGLTELPAHGVFIAIGHAPATELIRGQIKLKPSGYVEVAPNSTATSVPGVFAAGDVADETYRQAVTAAGLGCMAALEAERFLASHACDRAAAEYFNFPEPSSRLPSFADITQ
jgi:thioredoxin reductase (NADPH)